MAAHTNIRRAGRLSIVAVIALVVAGLGVPGNAQSSDPKKFTTAAEMYAVAPVRPFDDAGTALLKQAEAAIRSGAAIEDAKVWETLIKLNPYRKDDKSQTAVATWASVCAARIRGARARSGLNVTTLEAANQAYKAGKFKEASLQYRTLLSEDMNHYDVRNNLALAQMRLGNDLIAELELLVLRLLDENYVPGAVNLTVLCERLGQREKAQALAVVLLEKRKDVLAVVHNAAWYKDVAGKHEEALQTLSMLSDDESKAAFKPFRQLIEREAGRKPLFYQIGFAGLAGAYESKSVLTSAIVLFFIGSLVFIGIASAAAKGKPGCGTVILFTILYPLCWGLPVGAWWIMMVAYIILSVGITAAKSS